MRRRLELIKLGKKKKERILKPSPQIRRYLYGLHTSVELNYAFSFPRVLAQLRKASQSEVPRTYM